MRASGRSSFDHPNFQNPTGITLSAGHGGSGLYAIAAEHGLLIVEDDPYGKLRYSGQEIPPIKSQDDSEQVIYLSTVSKTIALGLTEVGWAVAQKEILRKLTLAKQGADLHTSSFDQLIVNCYLTEFDSRAHVEVIQAGLRRALLPDERGVEPASGRQRHVDASGGRDVPLGLVSQAHVDTNDLMLKAIEQDVLFVPGATPPCVRPPVHAAQLLEREAGSDRRRHRAACECLRNRCRGDRGLGEGP